MNGEIFVSGNNNLKSLEMAIVSPDAQVVNT